MTTIAIDNKTIQLDRELLNDIVSDVFNEYIELKEDEKMRDEIISDDSFENLTKKLKTTLWKL